MIYEVTDPKTGKVLELEGTSPPSESELEQIFSQHSKPNQDVLANPVYRALSKAESIGPAPSPLEHAASKTINQAKNIVNSGTFGLAGKVIPGMKPKGLSPEEEFQGSLMGGEVIGGAVINAGLKGVKNLYNIPAVKQSKVVGKAVEKFKSIFKPKTVARTMNQVNAADDKIAEGLTAIQKNKASIKLGDDIGRLPDTVEEGIAAANQTKESIRKQYTALRGSVKGGFAGEGATVNLGKVADSLKGSVDNIATSVANPGAKEYALSEVDRLMSIGSVSLDDAENIIKQYNAKLDKFYGTMPNINDAGRLTIDANIASLMRQELDDVILSATDKSYQALKNQYGAVVEVEKNLVKTLNKMAKTTKIPGVSSLDTVPILYGAFTGNKALLASGMVQKGIKMGVNRLRDPNLAVKSIFKILEGSSSPTAIQSAINTPLKGAAITTLLRENKKGNQ